MQRSHSWALAALVLAGSCTSPEPKTATQIIVEIDAETRVRDMASSLRVFVEGSDGVEELTGRTERLDETVKPIEFPKRIALVPLNGDDTRAFVLTATALDGDKQFVAEARVITGYVPGGVRYAKLLLEDACIGVDGCKPLETCVRAACEDARIDVTLLSDDGERPTDLSRLGPSDGGRPDAALDAGLDGGTAGGGDPCATNNGGCDALVTCIVSGGQVTCGGCPLGYTGDGHECTDIDECTMQTFDCKGHSACENTSGGYECPCDMGYNGDGKRECLVNVLCNAAGDNCDSQASCIEMAGTRYCVCSAGYDGNGGTCTDINECLTNNGGCGIPSGWQCANNPGAAPTCTDIGPKLTMVPPDKDFGPVNEGTMSSEQSFTLQNTGMDATGTLTTMLTGPDQAQFEITTDTCAGLNLAVLSTCTLTVRFEPALAGARTAAVSLSGASGGPWTVDLTGVSVGTAGRVCLTASECQVGNCVDGRCCNSDASTCNGCAACNVAGSEGTCTAVPVGDDPHGFCSQPCADKCDGAGACRPAPANTPCGPASTTCANAGLFYAQYTGTGYDDPVCNGTGLGCASTLHRQCSAGNICGSSACNTSCATDLDCTADFFCDTGVCAPARGTGATCSRPRMCGSRMCEGGVCQAGCYRAASAPASSARTDLAWTSPYPNACVLSGNGNNTIMGCSSPGQCAASGLGSVCSLSNCNCTSSSECTDSAAPHCATGMTYPQAGDYCACWVWNYTSGKFQAVRCRYGETCVVSAGTVSTMSITACKTRTGFPCGAASECAGGSCVNGTCQ